MNHVAIAKAILCIRTRNRQTQEEFARQLDVSRPTVSSWEAGKSVPTTEQLQKISKTFNVSVDEILQTKRNISVVVDTCVLMKLPVIISRLLGTEGVQEVIIPNEVVSELNYQKDHGKKREAWLAMASLERFRKEYPSRVIFLSSVPHAGINDQKIIAAARQFAQNNRNRTVYLLTDDVYFSLAAGKTANFQVLPLKELEDVFPVNAGHFLKEASIRFFQAVKENRLPDARKLFFKGVNPNFMDPESGYTPLIQAVRNKSIPMVEFIVNLPGIDLNICEDQKHRLPAISHAVQLDQMEIAKILVENGTDINCQSHGKNRGNTALMISAWEGKADFVRYLCQQGACVNQQDSNGFTALIKACIRKHIDCIRILCGTTDLEIRSLRGETAEDYLTGHIAQEKNPHAQSRLQEVLELFRKEQA